MGLFKDATVIEAKKPASRKPAAEEVTLAGLEEYAAIEAAITNLKALAEVRKESVRAAMLSRFLDKGCAAKATPANFKGVDGDATASCEMKIRSSASILSEEDLEILNRYGVPVETLTKQQEAFIINPKYNEDMDLLERVEGALADIGLPDDFLMRQEGVEVQVASREGIAEIFKMPRVDAEKLLPLVTVLSIKPALEGDCFAKLDAIMNPVKKTKTAK